MPTLCRPVTEGGVGFDYRLGMGTPDLWVKLVKEQRDENWSMSALVSSLCNRRRSERTVGYVESHDQSLVGDQTLGAASAQFQARSSQALLQSILKMCVFPSASAQLGTPKGSDRQAGTCCFPIYTKCIARRVRGGLRGERCCWIQRGA